jgi:hypothetical protein
VGVVSEWVSDGVSEWWSECGGGGVRGVSEWVRGGGGVSGVVEW